MYKKAIITADFPVLKEVLNGKNSILVPSDKYEEWGKAIYGLMDEGIRGSIAEKAYRDFKKKYSCYKRTILILESL